MDGSLGAAEQELGVPAGKPEPAPAEFVSAQQETVISKQPPAANKTPLPLEQIPRGISPQELGRLLEGTSLGSFRLEQFVGGGGMGAVFRAVDTMLGRTVAVKILSRDKTDGETLRRFKNEAQSAARLDHENIARVYHVGEDKGLHYIVFEFIEGVNLRELVDQKGPLSLAEAVSYILQVSQALEHASQRNVVHRDIKPSNVLVMSDGRAKLVDMGLARLHHLESEGEDLTASGVTLGTFDYISPEQARDPRLADVRSDLYSLGCTFYFMLTGRPPFPNGTVLQKLLSHSSEEPSDPRILRPELDEELVRIIHKLLAKQPGQRYQVPGELIGDLLLLAERLDLPNLTRGMVWVSPTQNALSLAFRSLPWLVPLAVLVAAVLTVERLWSTAPGQIIVESSRPALKPAPIITRSRPTEVPINSAGPVPPTASSEVHAAEETPQPAKIDSGDEANKLRTPRPTEMPANSDSQPQGSSGSDPENKPAADLGATSDDPAHPQRPLPDPPSAGPPTDPAAGAAKGTVAAPQVTRIVVGPPDMIVPEDARLQTSLAAACQSAVDLGVKVIELHFNGVRDEHPFAVAAKELTICSGAGYRPTILFQPTIEELSLDRRMVHVLGGDLTWQGVQLTLQLPTGSPDQCAFFLLRKAVSLDFRDVVLTVRNPSSEGRLALERTTVIELDRDASPVLPPSAELASTLLGPHIDLSNSVIRGQACFLRAEEAAPCRVVGQQCLFILRDRLLDVGGTRTKPSAKQGRIDLILRHVTAVLGRGMCRLSSDSQAPYQLDLVTDAKHSIIYLIDNSQPLIERRGVSGVAEVAKRLYVRGRDNFYPGSTTLLRIVSGESLGAGQDFDLDDREATWYEEESPSLRVMWVHQPTPPNRSEDQQNGADYRLDPSDNNPARMTSDESPAGVDPDRLPLAAEPVATGIRAVPPSASAMRAVAGRAK